MSKYLRDRQRKFELPVGFRKDGMFRGSSSPITCARFGCGKKLTLQEQLYGKYCFEHSGGKNIDIMMVLKLP